MWSKENHQECYSPVPWIKLDVYNLTALDIFKENLQQFSAVFVATTNLSQYTFFS